MAETGCGPGCACWCHRIELLPDPINELIIALYNEGWLDE